MAPIHATNLREAMRARAHWHEREAERCGGETAEATEEATHHRALAVQWRRLELRLFELSTGGPPIVRGE
ncbi:MAG: hypothetical protein HEQ38_16640 [Gemmatimonas sp.]|nr:hypothetical protein [Gemmatimonas sp.]